MEEKVMPCDYSKYPLNWKTEIVPAVLSRASDHCEECGLRNGVIVWGVWFHIKNDFGRYRRRSVWFGNYNDAVRESRGGHVREIRVVLTVSHTDHDESNHDVKLERLRALCQCCHLRYDAKEKYQRSMKRP